MRIRRQRAMAAARRDGVAVWQIAEAIGTTSANLSSIVSRGSQYSPFAVALDEWLETHGYTVDTTHDGHSNGAGPGLSASSPASHCPMPAIDDYLQLLASAHAERDSVAVGEALQIGATLARLVGEFLELRGQMERLASRLGRSVSRSSPRSAEPSGSLFGRPESEGNPV
ncbi:MAG TPA: hypothetical protein PLD73_09210 [Candidatus Hydrogenedentes bacterium]|nr:hypothetical protein [Candidatus Hydrogenedentota bacterium]